MANISLRPYQEELLQRVLVALEPEAARVMMQLPTGGGKTVIAGALLNEWLADGRKAVWLTHRRELAAQTHKMLTSQQVRSIPTPRWHTATDAPAIAGGVVILTAQTVGRRTTTNRQVWGRFDGHDLLVVDESHHAPAKGWERSIEQWPGKVLGMTATPWRLKKQEGFDHLFSSLVEGPQTVELQEEDALCEVTVWAPQSDQLILGGAIRAGDYTPDGITAANSASDGDVMTAGAVRVWKELAGERKTIMYAVSSGHARNLVKVLEDEGVRAAELLSDTPEEKRNWAVEAFKSDYLHVLVNLQIATEGFDLPDASCIVITRPTLSLALYLQMVGRGLRPKEDGGDCLILDLAGNYITHGLPTDLRQWSLNARGEQTFGDAPVQWCEECGSVSPASSHNCSSCGAPFGQQCTRCVKFRWWPRWEYEDYCGEAHDIVCDFCHNDAHMQANIPELNELAELNEEEELDMGLGDDLAARLTPILKELLEDEGERVEAEEDAKRRELLENVQGHNELLADDNRLDLEFTAHVNALPEERQPQSRPQERRLFNEWESGLKSDLRRWQTALSVLSNQSNEVSVLSRAQRKLTGLLNDVAEELGMRPVAATSPELRPMPKASGHRASSSSPAALISGELVRLSEFMPSSGDPRPTEIQFPDGTTERLRSQRHLLLATVKWLWQRGDLTEAHCPIGPKRGKNYYVSTMPAHSDGSPFAKSDRAPVGPYYVNTKLPYGQLVSATRTIIQQVGLYPTQFEVLLA